MGEFEPPEPTEIPEANGVHTDLVDQVAPNVEIWNDPDLPPPQDWETK